MFKKNLLLICIIIIAFLSCGNTKVGKVISVSDGDTFTLLTDSNTQIKVRVYGVDCPEKKQAFGQKAKQFTSDLIFNKVVTIECKGTDRYKRVLGIVTCEGKNLNKELLKNGFTWHYKKYDKSELYSKLEQEARDKKLGLWIDKEPIAPWEFRRQGKNKNSKL